MKPRDRFVALGALLALLLALYAGGLAARAGRAAQPLLFPGSRGADALALTTAGATVSLARDARGAWWLGDARYPADASKVASFLGELAALRSARVASSDAASWPEFGVDASAGTRIVASAKGRVVADLVVGLAGTTGDYVRPSGGATVYESTEFIGRIARSDSNFWSNLRVLPEDLTLDSLQSIAIRARDFEVGGDRVSADYVLISTVQNGRPAWAADSQRSLALDQQKVASVVAELIRLEADRFAPANDGRTPALGHPAATIVLTDLKRRHWVLDVGARDGTDFYVKREDEPYLYLVNQYSLQRAIRPLAALAAH